MDAFQHMELVNSQVAEQVNSLLSTRISTQVQYMTQEHFMISIRNFLEETNNVKIDELNENLRDKSFRDNEIFKLNDICRFYAPGSAEALGIQGVILKLRAFGTNGHACLECALNDSCACSSV